MKTKYNVNILFVFNVGIVAILTLGASYFILIPLIMFERNVLDVSRIVTQNYAMVGLWIIYFANIIFLPITRRKQDKNWKIGYVIFLIGIGIFVIHITGVLDCWEAMLSRFFGMDYNDRIRCLNEN